MMVVDCSYTIALVLVKWTIFRYVFVICIGVKSGAFMTMAYYGLGTKLLLHDGTTKLVQDLRIGDLLTGSDGTPKEVTSVTSGEDEMFEVTPVKGEPWVVGQMHVMCLYYSPRKHITYNKRDDALVVT